VLLARMAGSIASTLVTSAISSAPKRLMRFMRSDRKERRRRGVTRRQRFTFNLIHVVPARFSRSNYRLDLISQGNVNDLVRIGSTDAEHAGLVNCPGRTRLDRESARLTGLRRDDPGLNFVDPTCTRRLTLGRAGPRAQGLDVEPTGIRGLFAAKRRATRDSPSAHGPL
jgi:hypothetical protein